jgi:glycerol-3-phosphate acyltransferase PlsY
MIYAAFIAAYLLGSLSFAIIISKVMALDDPRSYGSKNAGATNVMRSGNKKAAALTLVGDLLKGSIVVWVSKALFHNIPDGKTLVAVCGVLAVIGHIYPIFFKFKGGKGVATAVGVLLGFSPVLALGLAVTWLIVFKISKVSSLSAIIATVLAPVFAYFLMGNTPYFGATLLIAFFVLYKHKLNIIRLINGEEYQFKR